MKENRYKIQVAVGVALLIIAVFTGVTSREWEQIDATVVSTSRDVEVVYDTDEINDSHILEMEYEYEVDGRTYRSDTMEYSVLGLPHTKISVDMDYAKWFLKKHPPGEKVEIYYLPHSPASAAWRRPISGFMKMVLLGALAFLITLIAFINLASNRARLSGLVPA